MNEMIERYIYDVTRRLPEKERGEIKRELEAGIADMVSDNPDEQEITEVLTKLGEPRILSEQYRQKPRYLISPAMFDSYIAVLKTVTAIVAGVLACIGAFLAFSADSLYTILLQVIGMAFEGALQAAFWVTVGFVIAEKCGYKKAPWKPADLPPLSVQNGEKIPRSSSLAGIILTVFFTVIFIMMIIRNERLFIFVRNSEIINLFSQAALHRFIPYLIVFGLMSLLINGLKLYWGRWNLTVCAANIIYNIVWVNLAVYVLYWSDLMNEDFIEITHNLNIFPGLTLAGIAITFTAIIFIAAASLDICFCQVKNGPVIIIEKSPTCGCKNISKAVLSGVEIVKFCAPVC